MLPISRSVNKGIIPLKQVCCAALMRTLPIFSVILRFHGEVAERFKAAVLKTVEGQPSGGSNPSLSANFSSNGSYQPESKSNW